MTSQLSSETNSVSSSMLTFNYSVAGDKSWLSSYRHPLQIMPQTTQYITDKHIDNFPMCSTCKLSNAVIHTSYITQPWRATLDETRFKKFTYLMSNYVKLCRRLYYKRLLIHLPSTLTELNNLSDGMNVLAKMFNQVEDVVLVLEIPAFKSGFKCDVSKYLLNVIVNYFDKFKYKNVELCIDTAHIFANGIDCKEMVNLFETPIKSTKLIDYCNIIHLNGNMNPMYKADIHCPIFDERNKMTNIDILMRYISDKNKILIAENTKQHADYTKWEQFAKQYNINIVPYDEHAQL